MQFKIVKYAGATLVLAWALIFSGCKKFLEERPPSNLSDNAFFTIPDHAEAGLVSVYANMRFIGNDGGIFSSTWQLLEAPTGTSTTETAQNSDLNNLYSLTYDGNTQHVRLCAGGESMFVCPSRCQIMIQCSLFILVPGVFRQPKLKFGLANN